MPGRKADGCHQPFSKRGYLPCVPGSPAVARLFRSEVVVFVVAVCCRAAVILRSGGLQGATGYDAAVYFAASDALTHGRLPYRDFVFLHPPSLVLALTPFAWVTRFASDQTAFMVANLSVTVVGGLSAVLVVRICRGLCFGRSAALAGGLFYATWFGTVGAEYHTKLEPLGNLLFLAAVLLAIKAQRGGSRWLSVAAGAVLGLTLCVKIWWILPVLGVIVWHAVVQRRARAAVPVLAGAIGTAVLVCLPFFIAAPLQMWNSVIVDQLGRGRRMNPLPRVGDLSTLTRLDGYLPRPALAVGVLIAAALFLLVVVRAWRARAARPVVVLLLVQLAVLLSAPSWFPYYCDYLAGALSITVAAAATRTSRRGRLVTGGVGGWLPTCAAATVTLVVLVAGTAAVPPLPGAARLSRAVANVRCVMSDSPMGLIELNALSRGLANGCPNWIDVTGRTYGPDRSPEGRSRAQNHRWQRDLTRYLRSGDAVIIVRGHGTGVSKRTQAAISRDGVLAHDAGQTVYRVEH